ncbi:MAG: anti-sigma factor family protein [Candidatus Polarisedimenticolia bacterium]
MTDGGCRETRDLLGAFIDDELPSDRSQTIQAHLHLCGGCQGFLRMEQSFNQEVKASLAWIEAPSGMMERLRAGLDDVDGKEGGPRRSRLVLPAWVRWGAYTVAAAVVLVVLLVPALSQYAPEVYDGARRQLTGAQRHTATLVCYECEREGAPMEAQRRCHAPGHQTGLRCPGTGLWHLVANDATLPIMRDRSRRGETVEVEGRWLDDIHYVDARQINPSGT